MVTFNKDSRYMYSQGYDPHGYCVELRMSQEARVGPFSAERLCAGPKRTEATLDLSFPTRTLRYTPAGIGTLVRTTAAADPSLIYIRSGARAQACRTLST